MSITINFLPAEILATQSFDELFTVLTNPKTVELANSYIESSNLDEASTADGAMEDYVIEAVKSAQGSLKSQRQVFIDELYERLVDEHAEPNFEGIVLEDLYEPAVLFVGELSTVSSRSKHEYFIQALKRHDVTIPDVEDYYEDETEQFEKDLDSALAAAKDVLINQFQTSSEDRGLANRFVDDYAESIKSTLWDLIYYNDAIDTLLDEAFSEDDEEE